jgi:hypothetical protein
VESLGLVDYSINGESEVFPFDHKLVERDFESDFAGNLDPQEIKAIT